MLFRSYLTRLENAADDKENFRDFRKSMIDWFNDGREIRKAEMALMLYIYEIRED